MGRQRAARQAWRHAHRALRPSPRAGSGRGAVGGGVRQGCECWSARGNSRRAAWATALRAAAARRNRRRGVRRAGAASSDARPCASGAARRWHASRANLLGTRAVVGTRTAAAGRAITRVGEEVEREVDKVKELRLELARAERAAQQRRVDRADVCQELHSETAHREHLRARQHAPRAARDGQIDAPVARREATIGVGRLDEHRACEAGHAAQPRLAEQLA
eukprot:scaffold1952_cov25-Tisochrysis_lutea.AAC.3